MEMKPIKVCVCGGGNGSHVTAGYLGAKKEFEVYVLTRKPQQWMEGIKEKGGLVVNVRKCGDSQRTTVIGKIAKVSSNPADVVPDADVIICGGPSHANPIYLEKIAPYVKEGAKVGALYGQGGFDWAAKYHLKDKFKKVTVFALQNIPWICRLDAYGKEASIYGPKSVLLTTAIPRSENQNIASLVEKMFDIPTKTLPNFLCITLTPSNQIIHPPRYYGIFKDWDGKKVYDPNTMPELYYDLDQFSADELQALSDELQSIKKAIEKKFPKIDLSSVKDLGERIVEQYGSDVKDKSTLKSIFNTNIGYKGCKTPVKQVEGGVIPNAEHRVFVEDIPYGLCILRDLADKLDLKVPKCDFLIEWHQKWMNKEYLKDGKLNPELIGETGTPSRYGVKTIEEVVEDYF